MTENELQSAVNTVRIWKSRRVVKGKTVTRADVMHRIQELWPEMTLEDVVAITDRIPL